MGIIDSIKQRIRNWLGVRETILCDTCKWDWRSACHHAERPNAVKCPDYEKRGT